jgi:ribosome-associated toxin RatA of RatAB toxin-antitoxin module
LDLGIFKHSPNAFLLWGKKMMDSLQKAPDNPKAFGLRITVCALRQLLRFHRSWRFVKSIGGNFAMLPHLTMGRKSVGCICGIVIAPLSILSSNLEFPDSAGKIVGRTQEYVVRLVETPQSDIKTAEAIFVIKGLPQTCIDVISDFKHYPEFMPHISFAELVEQQDSCVIFRFGFKVALRTIRYTNSFKRRSPENDHYALTWDYVNGDLKNSTGSWDVEPCLNNEGYSMIRYRAFIDTGMFVPRWVCNLLTAKAIPKMIKAIAERVKSKEG